MDAGEVRMVAGPQGNGLLCIRDACFSVLTQWASVSPHQKCDGTSDHGGSGGYRNKNAGPLKHGPAQFGQPQFHSASEVRHAWNWNELERN